jgi:hypothetical protein
MVSNKFILLRYPTTQQRYVAGKDRLQFFTIKNNQIDGYFLNLFRDTSDGLVFAGRTLFADSGDTVKPFSPRHLLAKIDNTSVKTGIDCCGARVRFWHKADITTALTNVRFWG